MGREPINIYFYARANSYFEFSNFYIRPFTLEGRTWLTVEHYFQAMKSRDEVTREMIRKTSTPAVAKKIGVSIELREDWEEVKEEMMYKAVRAKFSQHEDLRRMLLATGDALLHENSPKDMYWGVLGKDRLGVILMRVRDDIDKEII
jgi:N-glycosidase YbiA